MANTINATTDTQGNLYGWDGEAWSEVAPGTSVPMNDERLGADVRIATLNVLADCFPAAVELAIQSPVRYAALVGEVERLDATVLGLNEVTATSLGLLLASPHVRRHYSVSHLPEQLPGPHATVLLARRWAVVSSHMITLSGATRHSPGRSTFPAFVVRYGYPRGVDDAGVGPSLAVGALHTLAYQSSENRAIRGRQIQCFTKALQSIATTAGFPTSNVAIMGDLNMHYVNEDVFLVENGLVDAWAETHLQPGGDGEPGFTFDTVRNAMIPRYIPGEHRRMRLDRILVAEGAQVQFTGPCQLFGTEPVTSEAYPAMKDLALSDHYGLVVPVQFTGRPLASDPEVQKQYVENARRPNEPRGFTYIRFAGHLVLHTGFLAKRLLGLR